MANATMEENSSQLPPEHMLPALRDPPFEPVPPKKLARRDDADHVFRSIAPGLEWKVSTHVYPAAWPRSRQRSAQNRSKPFESDIYRLGTSGRAKTPEEAAWLTKHQEAPLVDMSHPSAYQDQVQLWMAVHRYVPKKRRTSNKRGLTLLCCHAGGFHGQAFEVMLAYLLSSSAGQHIDEVWALDGANCGDSALLNRDLLGDTYCWVDNSRDVAKFILQYMPEHGSSDPPELLRKQDVDRQLLLLDERRGPSSLRGMVRGHRILGIGQSYGGATMAMTEEGCPGLFSAFCFLDAMLTRRPEGDEAHGLANFGETAIAGVLARRDHWPNRESVARAYSNNGAFASYHDEVLKRYIEHGFTDSSDGGVELKCLKQQEALLFIEPGISATAGADRLHELHPRLHARTHFILAHPARSWCLPDDHKRNLAVLKGSTAERVDSAHLIVQEAPEAVARGIERFVGRLQGGDSTSTRSKL